jgi:hypothetical protein
VKVTLHSFLTWALDGDEWWNLNSGNFIPGKEPRYLYWWLQGSQSGSGWYGENCLVSAGIQSFRAVRVTADCRTLRDMQYIYRQIHSVKYNKT